MKQYLVKLDRHIEVIRQWQDGEFKFIDKDENEIFFPDIPDYILELGLRKLNGESKHAAYFYPKDFELFRDEFWVWIHPSSYEIDEFLKDIKKTENVDILSVNEIQTELHKN